MLKFIVKQRVRHNLATENNEQLCMSNYAAFKIQSILALTGTLKTNYSFSIM